MATDEREEEREFLAGLKARTGRELADWMAAITARGFADKNEAIDWLREQGLPFARASWLERIHRNGGRPIYADNAPRESEPRRAGSEAPARRTVLKPARAEEPLAAGDTQSSEKLALEKLVAAAKGYRPLYHLLESEVRRAVPDLMVTPKPGYVSFGAPAEFGAVTLHSSEVRLGLDLGERPFDALYQKAKLKGPGPAITHMVVLTDARQVNEELLCAVRAAKARVNGAQA